MSSEYSDDDGAVRLGRLVTDFPHRAEDYHRQNQRIPAYDDVRHTTVTLDDCIDALSGQNGLLVQTRESESYHLEMPTDQTDDLGTYLETIAEQADETDGIRLTTGSGATHYSFLLASREEFAPVQLPTGDYAQAPQPIELHVSPHSDSSTAYQLDIHAFDPDELTNMAGYGTVKTAKTDPEEHKELVKDSTGRHPNAYGRVSPEDLPPEQRPSVEEQTNFPNIDLSTAQDSDESDTEKDQSSRSVRPTDDTEEPY